MRQDRTRQDETRRDEHTGVSIIYLLLSLRSRQQYFVPCTYFVLRTPHPCFVYPSVYRLSQSVSQHSAAPCQLETCHQPINNWLHAKSHRHLETETSNVWRDPRESMSSSRPVVQSSSRPLVPEIPIFDHSVGDQHQTFHVILIQSWWMILPWWVMRWGHLSFVQPLADLSSFPC